VVACGGRDADEGHAGIEGGALRDVDGTATTDTDRELEGAFADPLLPLPDLVPRGVRDQKDGAADLPCGEFLLDRLARDLVRGVIRDEEGLLPELQGLAYLADLVKGVVSHDDVPREFHRLRLAEGLLIYPVHKAASGTSAKPVSLLKCDDPNLPVALP